MSNSNHKNWDDKTLIDLLDKILSAHGLMKEELHQTELELEVIVNRLADKFIDKYEAFRTGMKQRHEKGSKQYGMLTSRLVHTLGLEEGKKYICGNPNEQNEQIKKYDKDIVNLEKQFKELNPKKISHINGEYLIEFLKNDGYKLYKHKEKIYIKAFGRIKEFYEEYKSRLTSSDALKGGEFKKKDEENPDKYRNSYAGKDITYFMENYITEVDAYLNMDGYHTPLVLLKKENHKNDKIMKRHQIVWNVVSRVHSGGVKVGKSPGKSVVGMDMKDFDDYSLKRGGRRTRRRRKKLKRKTKRRNKKKRKTKRKRIRRKRTRKRVKAYI